jgi:hypothetical protein
LRRRHLSARRHQNSEGGRVRCPSAFLLQRHQLLHPHLQHPAARFALPSCRTDSTSEPAAAEFGGDLWWCTICSYGVSRLDRHVTYYTSHMCTYVYTRLSLPSLKYSSSSLALNVFTSLHSMCNQRKGIGLLEYQVMPSLRDVAPDGQLCTFTI